uniref:Angiotensin-converting enzyme n=1 Tax=Daphnia galeata TaxID=27404 RepID=A0A8J2S1L6_9CRUS|nr:unnamed protein product [Daphnia galeata]
MEVVKIFLFLAFVYSSALAINIKSKKGRSNSNEDDAIDFLANYDSEYGPLKNQYLIASWNYETNLTDENALAVFKTVTSGVAEAYYGEASANASQFDSTTFSEDTKRQLSYLQSVSLDDAESEELNNLLSEMGRIYGSYQACRSNPSTGINECMYLEPELTELMAKNENYDDHLWAWQAWHDGVGRQLRPLYLRVVELSNKQAQLNGYDDYGDQWRQRYETTEMETIVQDLYAQVEPLYKQLHAYIRRKLYDTYGADKINLRGPLPAHLLGDMWGRFWVNLNPIAIPYPDKPSTDPSPEMIRQNYTAERMFRTGNDFYTSMGLLPVPDTFWNFSMLEKPKDGREVICHATAWDFYDAKDFRIRMCTRVVFEDFQTVHHELGHIQYCMQYSFQPLNYRAGANDGFHEAVGELMSMSFSTTKHLNTLGLLNVPDDPDVDMNFLLFQALNTISTLPFHLTQDTWRWSMFRGDIPTAELNDKYWAEKARVVGVAPPVERDPTQDLDITAIYHVCVNSDMIRYFMRTFFQYQFNEVLCQAAGHTGPLYKCDFYNSTAAGDALSAMLKLGASKPWQDAMEAMTGQRDVLASPLLNYFEPLMAWLEAENAKNGEYIGWDLPSTYEESPITS